MPSLLDPLPDEGQQLVDLVAKAYSWNGKWPVWQYVAQQAFGKHGIDADAALRNLPQWPWLAGSGYRAVRTVPAAAGNSSPTVEARTVLTVYGLFHSANGSDHPLVHTFLKAIDVAAGVQGGATLSPTTVTPITIAASDLASIASHRASTDFTAETLGLLLQAEPATSGGGVHESSDWTWDLTQYRPLQPFVSDDARSYLIKLDALLGTKTPQSYKSVNPETLPRALDHLNVVWKVVTEERLFYPRGLAGAASLVEPVTSGDQLTARLGALADIFDLFLRTADGKPIKGGSLKMFGDQLVRRLSDDATQQQARTAVEQLVDINRIRNGRLHTDATNWAESLHRLGVPSSESPAQQWERIRSITVGAVYAVIQLLEPLIP
jgi:hypothetical protein